MPLNGKTAVVTGAGRGLGKAIALELAARGVKVSLFSRTEAEIQKVADEITAGGGKALALAGDVAVGEDVQRLKERTLDHFDSLDILVNNAAVIGPARFMEAESALSWHQTLSINLLGAYLCCRAMLPTMAARKRGKIINLTSGLGSRPFPRFCAYGVSKAGIDQLTRSLASEFEPDNIQVNSLDPGVMDTRMQDEIRRLGPAALGNEIFERFQSLKEQNALRDPRQVAEVAVFLASEEADHVTGQIVSLSDLPRLKGESR